MNHYVGRDLPQQTWCELEAGRTPLDPVAPTFLYERKQVAALLRCGGGGSWLRAASRERRSASLGQSQLGQLPMWVIVLGEMVRVPGARLEILQLHGRMTDAESLADRAFHRAHDVFRCSKWVLANHDVAAHGRVLR